MLKRFVVFVYEIHGAAGGWDDLHNVYDKDGHNPVSSWDTIEEAREVEKQALSHGLMDGSHIVDLKTGDVY